MSVSKLEELMGERGGGGGGEIVKCRLINVSSSFFCFLLEYRMVRFCQVSSRSDLVSLDRCDISRVP